MEIVSIGEAYYIWCVVTKLSILMYVFRFLNFSEIILDAIHSGASDPRPPTTDCAELRHMEP